MNLKNKLATTKNKIKENATAIIGTLAVGLVATSAALIHAKMKLSLDVSRDDLEVLKTEDSNLTYSIDGSDYSLSYRGNTPKR